MRAFLMVSILLLISCSNSAPPPEQIVEEYWNAILKEDYDAAWNFVSNKTKAEITKEQFIARYVQADEGKLYKLLEVSVGKPEVSGNQATIPTNLKFLTIFGEKTKTQTSNAINENGRWRFLLSDTFVQDAREATLDDKELLSKVTHGSILVMGKNWDADAEDDGLVVFPALKDSTDEEVQFKDVELPVGIRVFSLKRGDDWQDVEDRIVYQTAGAIDSWEDGNPFMGQGIRIPYEEISLNKYDLDRGVIYSTVTLPDGRKIEAKSEERIRPLE